MFRRILVPVDFTKKNLRAVRLAARLAALRRGELVLLHVIERVDAGDPAAFSGFYKKLEGHSRKKLQGLIASAGQNVAARGEVLYGKRIDEILRFAALRRVDLIVMSSHRLALRRPGESWGTISYKVGLLAKCPVLLVK